MLSFLAWPINIESLSLNAIASFSGSIPTAVGLNLSGEEARRIFDNRSLPNFFGSTELTSRFISLMASEQRQSHVMCLSSGLSSQAGSGPLLGGRLSLSRRGKKIWPQPTAAQCHHFSRVVHRILTLPSTKRSDRRAKRPD